MHSMLTHTTLLALKKEFSDALLRYEPGRVFEQHKWEFSTHSGKVAVQALRGQVFEKACISEITATVTLPKRSHETSIEWLGVQIFPVKPAGAHADGGIRADTGAGRAAVPVFF